MVISAKTDREQRFIIGLVDDSRGYVFLGDSTVNYFDFQTLLQISKDPMRRDKIVWGDRFSELLDEESLIEESHRLKRESGHRNARGGLPYHLRKTGGEIKQRMLCAANRNLRRDVRDLHRLKLLRKFAENEGVLCDGLNELQVAKAVSLKSNVTLLTTDQRMIGEYVRAERNGSPEGRRFEMALLYPSERSFSYFYPELAKSERFDDCYELSEVA